MSGTSRAVGRRVRTRHLAVISLWTLLFSSVLVVVSIAPAGSQTDLRFWRVEAGTACGEPAPSAVDATGPLTLGAGEALCTNGTFQLKRADNTFQTTTAEPNVLTLSPDFHFDLAQLTMEAISVDVGMMDADDITISIVRDIQLDVAWQSLDTPVDSTKDAEAADQDGGDATQAGEPEAEAEDKSTDDQPGETSDDAPATEELAGVQQQVLGAAGATKTITVTGRDAVLLQSSTEEFSVRDQLAETIRVDSLPENVEASENDVQIPLAGSDSISYRLSAQKLAPRETALFTQETELLLNGVSIARSAPQQLTLAGPTVKVAVSSSGFEGGTSTLTVLLENAGDVSVSGPLTVTLTTDSDSLETLENPSNGGEIKDGKTVVWTILAGLEPNRSHEWTVTAKLQRLESDRLVRWTVDVHQGGEETVALAANEATTEVAALASKENVANVDFTPGQLIRLMAFVVSFGIMAIIFGAWSRTRRLQGRDANDPDIDKALEHETMIFKSFSESIIVLVILVSILVLALRGSLQAESAASLIGVIAGYALGQGRRG